MKPIRHSTIFLALLAAGLLTAATRADSDDDHERARRAFEAGQIVSLASIIEHVERDFEGELLEVELEGESRHGFVYEVKLLAPGGAIVELLFDAGNGELLRSSGHGLDRLDHGDSDEDEEDEN